MYQHGKRTKRKSSPKVWVHASFILGLSLVIGAYLLQKDMASGGTKEKTTEAIVTEISEDGGSKLKVDGKFFSMDLPSDWKQTNRVQEPYANFYEWKGTKKGGDDRTLRLHIDILPKDYKIVRMQPLTPNGNSFMLGNVSGNCVDYAKDAPGGANNTPVEAKWEGVTFTCDPIVNNQSIGTGSVEGGIGSSLGGHTYFFYYEDHNIRPDDKILIDALRSFTTK